MKYVFKEISDDGKVSKGGAIKEYKHTDSFRKYGFDAEFAWNEDESDGEEFVEIRDGVFQSVDGMIWAMFIEE